VKLAAVIAGHAFVLAPTGWSHPIPDAAVWCPLAGHPLVRRTWVAWKADSHRRDLGHLIVAFDRSPRGGGQP
jgi:hypothetical protein